jgi:hypothetical protein
MTAAEILPSILVPAAFFSGAFVLSRVGPSIDARIVRLAKGRLQATAECLSWSMCAITLMTAAAIVRVTGNLRALLPLGLLSAAHCLLMLKQRRAIAFRLAAFELMLGLLFFSMIFTGDPEKRSLPRVSIELGTVGFWLWSAGAILITTAGWVCQRAAKRAR